MKQVRRNLLRLLRPLALAALAGTGLAQANDYAEITQLLKAGKPADALAKADQRLSTAPRDPQLRFLRGVAQADAGKQNDAIATFTQLTEEYPELPEPYNNLAVLYAGQNQLDKARAALEMAIRTHPGYATAHENLGDLHIRLAAQAYEKALQIDAGKAGSIRPKLALIRRLSAAEGSTGTPPSAAPKAGATAPAPAPAKAPVSDAGTGQSVNAALSAPLGHGPLTQLAPNPS